jgi:hypothetical protein
MLFQSLSFYGGQLPFYTKHSVPFPAPLSLSAFGGPEEKERPPKGDHSFLHFNYT